MIIAKSNLCDKIKQDFFQAVSVSILMYGCINWTLTKHLEKKKLGTIQECSRLFWTNPESNTKQNSSCMATYLPSHKVRQTRHARHCWRSNALQWIPTHEHQCWLTSKDLYIYQFCVDTECSLEDLPGVMD